MKKTFSKILVVTLFISIIAIFPQCDAKKETSEVNKEQQKQQQFTPQVETDVPVSNDEVVTFIKASIRIQDSQNELRTASINLVQNSDMGIERFQEIANSQNDPNNSLDASKQEMEEFTELTDELTKMQINAQNDAETIIEEDGMEPERYKAISMAAQKDNDLQQRLQQEYMKQSPQQP